MSDQPRRPVETPDEWLRYADENLQVAEREMQPQTVAFHTIFAQSITLFCIIFMSEFT